MARPAPKPPATKAEDPGRARPLTIPFLRDLGALDGFAPPAGPFDPAGEWTHTYHLWMVHQGAGGCLRLTRTPADGGGARLLVELDVSESTGYLRRTKATLHCAPGALATPTAWTLESQELDLDDQPVAGTGVSETGTLAGGRMEVRFAGRSRVREVPKPVTSHWSLFDAVQRLGGETQEPLEFAMLEEMDLLKPEQRLEFREAADVDLGGRTLRLRCYQQIGRGVLPWQYWADERGRLLLAFSGVRAYLYDADGPSWMQKKLDAARTRAKRRKTP